MKIGRVVARARIFTIFLFLIVFVIKFPKFRISLTSAINYIDFDLFVVPRSRGNLFILFISLTFANS